MKTPEENRYQKIMLLLLLFISINKYTSAQTTCNEPIRIRTNITLCQGDTYQFGDRIITSSGIYIQTYQTVNNCDSIATLGVDYLNSTNFSFTETITTNESYFFKEQNLTAAGIYRDTFADSRGCDSILTLTLQVIAEQENCANGIDDDGDGLVDCDDPDCSLVANTGGSDTDGDGIDNNCEEDSDGDGIDNPLDLDNDDDGILDVNEGCQDFNISGTIGTSSDDVVNNVE